MGERRCGTCAAFHGGICLDVQTCVGADWGYGCQVWRCAADAATEQAPSEITYSSGKASVTDVKTTIASQSSAPALRIGESTRSGDEELKRRCIDNEPSHVTQDDIIALATGMLHDAGIDEYRCHVVVKDNFDGGVVAIYRHNSADWRDICKVAELIEAEIKRRLPIGCAFGWFTERTTDVDWPCEPPEVKTPKMVEYVGMKVFLNGKELAEVKAEECTKTLAEQIADVEARAPYSCDFTFRFGGKEPCPLCDELGWQLKRDPCPKCGAVKEEPPTRIPSSWTDRDTSEMQRKRSKWFCHRDIDQRIAAARAESAAERGDKPEPPVADEGSSWDAGATPDWEWP